jgi:uncharacterized RDD family membrane protein YckC
MATPEGVVLHLARARAGDRLFAYLVDVLITSLLGYALVLLVVIASHGSMGFAFALTLLLLFFLRYFYFVFFEVRWSGQTPGKRLAGIRVAQASGGPLSADAVLVRNFTRDLEVQLPLALILGPQTFWPGAPPWLGQAAGLWAVVLAAVPFLNRNRQRLGDLAAATIVVKSPKVFLLDDLGTALPRQDFTFSDAQLDVYAIYELQVLEGVLRRGAGAKNQAALAEVAKRIQAKIGWQGVAEPHAFLRAFYTALRARLEHRMVLGDKRERRKP